jgi:hypothetical protein
VGVNAHAARIIESFAASGFDAGIRRTTAMKEAASKL